jgi:hypothetical protein
MRDVKAIGMPTNFKLVIRPYSKTFYGNYLPDKRQINLYVYSDEQCTKLYSYESLLLTFIHEITHCIQWSDPNYRRVKGIMHNAQFKELYANYSNRARALLLLREVVHVKNNSAIG